MYCVLCTVYSVLCILYCVLCTLCTLYSVLCTVYSVLCTLSTLCTVYSVLCTMYSMYSVRCVLCTLCKEQFQHPTTHPLTTCPSLISRLAWARGYLSQTIMHCVQPIMRYSICNSLQFFERLVLLQCFGQSYNSSVSHTSVCETTVGYTCRRVNISQN